MNVFAQCGYFVLGPDGLERCFQPAAFTGANADDVVAVACWAHRDRLKHPTAIHGVEPTDDETLARVAENQAAMEELLNSSGGM